MQTNCASDNDRRTGGEQKLTCQPTETLCELDAGSGMDTPHCANLQTDDANCGSCGNMCTQGNVCSESHCGASCPPGETMCGAATEAGSAAGVYCAALQSDDGNCGCCGNVCGSSQGCRSGRCDDTTSFSFFVFGDMHVGPTSFNTTVQIALNQMTQLDANVIGAVSNGDLVDIPSDTQWTEHDSFVSNSEFQLDEPCAASFGAQKRYFGTVGDHDIGPANWNSLWNQHLPALQNLGSDSDEGIYYSVKFANAFFVMLDSEHVTLAQASAQTSWLKSTLESADARSSQLKFIFFHSPVYSCSSRHAPLAEALPWVDLAEQNNVNVIFGSHTHVYTRTCPKRGGTCIADGSGIIFVETGAVGGLPRAVDVTTATASGTDAAGNPRADAYNCVVGQDLMAARGLDNDFCHVKVDGCQATVNCHVVGDGNYTPFDTWTINGCACQENADAGETCQSPADGGVGD